MDPAVEPDHTAAYGAAEASVAGMRGPRTLRLLRLLAFVVVPGLFVGVLAVGERGPDLALPLLEGEGTLTSAELRGSPVVLNVWASWCIPCREEAPVLERAWSKYRTQGVRFVGVNVQDSKADAKAFVREFGITFPSVRDTDLELWGDLGVRGVPETFFLDHRWRFSGTGSGDQIDRRGGTKVLGAIPAPVLERQIGVLLEAKGKER